MEHCIESANLLYIKRQISKVKINEKYNAIKILFEDTDKYNILSAEADCCSESWFYFFEDKKLGSIVGKSIKNIEYREDIDLPSSGVQECDINSLYRMNFTDGTYFEFVLRNSSNGYYNGWLEVHRY
ncbi:hypothetical protein QJ850_gp686 [Acanthamoeba polyphaga mimivirus]|uniref:DUF7448 domain-containing protein n=1 Tax=Acanthamoeba polyphaga mimivirus Kroon TaxID=3069720 RepID=A0A0G2Y2P7_9VIRU|nr:hypothetical protein QJ850_gp686 [Acanthamoeba polyphaga mimivirus]AKI80013.1 hypothetical protein [Acanthamoeba polyphaga mimivirus Kroon]